MLSFFATTLGRNILIGIAGALVLGFLVWGVNHALDRAEKAGEARIQARWDAEKAGREQARAELSSALSEAFNGLDSSLQGAIKTISYKGRDITIRVKKEMDDDPRYSDPLCSLGVGVFEQVNAARSLSHPAAASGVRDGGVPTSGAAVRFDLGGAGDR